MSGLKCFAWKIYFNEKKVGFKIIFVDFMSVNEVLSINFYVNKLF